MSCLSFKQREIQVLSAWWPYSNMGMNFTTGFITMLPQMNVCIECIKPQQNHLNRCIKIEGSFRRVNLPPVAGTKVNAFENQTRKSNIRWSDEYFYSPVQVNIIVLAHFSAAFTCWWLEVSWRYDLLLRLVILNADHNCRTAAFYVVPYHNIFWQ